MMKNKPCEMAPSITPNIIQTIQKPIHTRLKKIDWKAWKRTKRSALKGSITRNKIPVMAPTRYARAPATLGVSPAAGAACGIVPGIAPGIGPGMEPGIAPGAALDAATPWLAPQAGQAALPSDMLVPQVWQKLMVFSP